LFFEASYGQLCRVRYREQHVDAGIDNFDEPSASRRAFLGELDERPIVEVHDCTAHAHMINSWENMQLTFSNQVAIAVFFPLAMGTVFTFLTVWVSGRNAGANARRQNELAARMKLADFRQAWINELRNCFSDFQSRGIIREPMEVREMQRIAFKIRLLMNKKDVNYGSLDSLIRRLLDNADQQASMKIVEEMTPVCQGILKEEWEVLKRDLSYNAPLKGSA
jgi:hypothetical protein